MVPNEKKKEALLLFLMLIALCSAVIWVRTETVKDTYRFVQQEKELYLLQQQTQATRIRWLQLTSPKRLESLAKLLGLEPPRREQIVRYDAGSTTTQLTRNP